MWMSILVLGGSFACTSFLEACGSIKIWLPGIDHVELVLKLTDEIVGRPGRRKEAAR
jgi:hypothetical protein